MIGSQTGTVTLLRTFMQPILHPSFAEGQFSLCDYRAKTD